MMWQMRWHNMSIVTIDTITPLSRYIYIYIYIYIKKNSYNFLWFGNKNIKLNFHDQISMNELVQRQNSAKA